MSNVKAEGSIKPLDKNDTVFLESCLKFGRILRNLGVTHVYSFDDEWTIDEGKDDSMLQRILEMQVNVFIKTFGLVADEDLSYIIEENSIDDINDLMESEIPDLSVLKNEVNRIIANERSDAELKSLEEIFSEVYDLEGIIFEKINEKPFRNIIKNDQIHKNEGRILFLLDRNMEKTEGGSNDEVVDTLQKMNNMRKGKFDLFIVYSNEELTLFENHEKKAIYVRGELKKLEPVPTEFSLEEQQYLLAYQLWAVKKTKDRNRLLDTLKETLEKAVFGHSLHDYLQMKMIGNKKAIIDLISLSEEKFEYLYKEAFVEGEMFLDLLERTKESIEKKAYYELLSDSTYLKSLRNISLVAATKATEIVAEIRNKYDDDLSKFRKNIKKDKIDKGLYKDTSDHYVIDYSVNSLFKDITAGDIYKFNIDGNEVYGLLVNVSCDLVVRYPGDKQIDEDIRRVDGEYASLLLFKLKNVQDVRKMSNASLAKLIWPINMPDVVEGYSGLLLEDNSVINLDIRILDLCSLNNNGYSSTSPTHDYVTYKTYQFNKYVSKELLNWVDGVGNLKNYLSGGLSDFLSTITCEDKSKQREILESMVKLKYGIDFDYSGKKFMIQRVGRLNIQKTLDFVQKYVSKASRVGVPGPPLN